MLNLFLTSQVGVFIDPCPAAPSADCARNKSFSASLAAIFACGFFGGCEYPETNLTLHFCG
jgi:hypothetical protein